MIFDSFLRTPLIILPHESISVRLTKEKNPKKFYIAVSLKLEHKTTFFESFHYINMCQYKYVNR